VYSTPSIWIIIGHCDKGRTFPSFSTLNYPAGMLNFFLQHALFVHIRVYLSLMIVYNTGNPGYHWYLCSSAQEWSWQSPHSWAGLCDIIFVQYSSVSCLHASTDHFLSSWGKVSLSCEDGNSWNTKPARDKRRLNHWIVCTLKSSYHWNKNTLPFRTLKQVPKLI